MVRDLESRLGEPTCFRPGCRASGCCSSLTLGNENVVLDLCPPGRLQVFGIEAVRHKDCRDLVRSGSPEQLAFGGFTAAGIPQRWVGRDSNKARVLAVSTLAQKVLLAASLCREDNLIQFDFRESDLRGKIVG